MTLRLIALTFLALLSTACGPKPEHPSFNTVRLINHTEKDVSYAISLNGAALPDLTLKSKEGILFYATTPSLAPAKIDMKSIRGGEMGFRGTNIQLDTVRNGEGTLSPQGSFSSFRYFNLESARASKEYGWREIEASEISIIDVRILTEK